VHLSLPMYTEIRHECKLSERQGTMMVRSKHLIVDKILRLSVVATLVLVFGTMLSALPVSV